MGGADEAKEIKKPKAAGRSSVQKSVQAAPTSGGETNFEQKVVFV